jgi:hypothetical protein
MNDEELLDWKAARMACSMGAKIEFQQDDDVPDWIPIPGPNWWANGDDEFLEKINADYRYRLAFE